MKSDGLTGTQRAAKRLAAKREANKAIPGIVVETRQQRRAWERQNAKGVLRRDEYGTVRYR